MQGKLFGCLSIHSDYSDVLSFTLSLLSLCLADYMATPNPTKQGAARVPKAITISWHFNFHVVCPTKYDTIQTMSMEIWACTFILHYGTWILASLIKISVNLRYSLYSWTHLSVRYLCIQQVGQVEFEFKVNPNLIYETATF